MENLFGIKNRTVSICEAVTSAVQDSREEQKSFGLRVRALDRALRGVSGSRIPGMLLPCPIGAARCLNRVLVVACAALDLLIFRCNPGACGSPYAALRADTVQY